MRNRLGWWTITLASLTLSCTGLELVCPVTPFPAIEVLVRDAVTGDPAWWGTSGIVRDGGFADSLVATSDSPEDSVIPFLLAAAFGRPGTYDVTVEKPGFKAVQFDGVTAGVDAECNAVIPERLEIDLEKEPI